MKGTIIQRSKGSWTLVFDMGRDGQGKRKQKWKTVRGTKANAEQELRRVLRSLDTGEYVEPTKLSVAEYLERWLKDYARNAVAPKTFERYSEIVRCHLIPALGDQPLAKLHPLHIQDHYSEALESGRLNGKGGLSAQTVLHHHRVLREALQQAVKWLLLARNPADAVVPPRPVRKEVLAIDEATVELLMDALKDHRLYTPVLMALTTGMRRGEILGLRWRSVDLDTGTLVVRESLSQTKDGLNFKAPKSGKGRTVALPSLPVTALQAHKVEQARNRLSLGPVYNNHYLVFAKADGEPWEPNSFTNAFTAFVLGKKLPHMSFHSLRHTHATLLLKQGIHPKVVSERLGHAKVGITLDIYSHVLPGMQEEAAQRIDSVLRSAISPSP